MYDLDRSLPLGWFNRERSKKKKKKGKKTRKTCIVFFQFLILFTFNGIKWITGIVMYPLLFLFITLKPG